MKLFFDIGCMMKFYLSIYGNNASKIRKESNNLIEYKYISDC